MRIIALLPVALLAACQVTEGNNSTTVSYNQDVAENAAEDVANGAKEAGEAIANSAADAGAAIKEGAAEVRNTDVDVTVSNKAATNSQ